MPEEKQILIVDDSEEMVVFLKEILEDQGYRYRVARNGKEALKAMQEYRPGLVLLDIMMPRKWGISVYHEMKKNVEMEKIPIIIITGASEVLGVAMKTGEEMPKETYADDFARPLGIHLYEKLKNIKPNGLIEKPIDPAVLTLKIKELLS